MIKRIFYSFLVVIALLPLGNLAHARHKELANNACHLFLHHPRWLWAAEAAQHRWHVPISEMMAIMYQESHFKPLAAPKRRKLFNVIPWFRPTTALGYAQATDATWRLYCRNRGKLSADRSSFDDAVDFVAWYVSYAHQKLRISKTDAYSAYLAYHEGINGYIQKSYRYKLWLKHVAHKVKKRTARYHYQLVRCINSLPKRPWWY